MANQENFLNIQSNDNQDESVERATRIIEGDTYPISDNESTSDSVYLLDTNTVKLQQGELNHSMSQDSLTNADQNNKNKTERPSSTTNSKISSKMSTIKSGNGLRSLALDEHIKLVKQKKEEAEILRLQKFQEQLRKKEQKWQQQQVERVKKWLQLRNRDCDHRLQVEERRRKREEEAKAKIDELLRREKEREQRVNHIKTSVPQKTDVVMSMSTDIPPTRRAISASRLRSNHQDITNRRISNDSHDDNSTTRDENIHPQSLTNGDSHRRISNTNRHAKPRNITMTQSVHVGKSSNGIPLSRSSHQIRMATPPAATIRKNGPSRPATVPTSNNQSRTSPSDDSSSMKQSIHRPKLPSSSTKPPTFSSSSRSKPPTQRSLMTTSHSSSSLSSSTIPNKRRIAAVSPSKTKPEIQPVINTNKEEKEEENLPVNEEVPPPPTASTDDTVTEMTNSIKLQPTIDEQEYQRKLNQKIREAQQRLEIERQREEERKRQLEFEEYEREQEQIHLVEEQRRVEQERLQRAIEERERENELKRQEEQRLQQQREELERKQLEETERLNRERQERAKKEEEERNERKKRLDLIMRRTRQISPNSKQENNSNKPTIDQTNGHNQTNNISTPTAMIKSSIPHSISETHFPTSSSTDNFLLNNDSIPSPMMSSTTDTPKFKSPLIQSLLNKARNTRSTDNLIQTSMTASQIMTESMVDESITAVKSTTPTDLSDDDHQENTTNGHNDLHLNSSYHDRPMEAATAFQ